MWRIPLIKGATRASSQNTDTIAVRQAPQQILQSMKPPTQDIVSNVYEVKTKPELVRYYHTTAGSPTKSSWLVAIRNGHYESWPGLNVTVAAKHFPESHETWKGHGRKIKSGLRSTKLIVEEEEQQTSNAIVGKERAVHLKDFNLKDAADRIMYSDQKGRFRVTSFKGNQYVMTLFETVGNTILVEPMQSRRSREMMRAY